MPIGQGGFAGELEGGAGSLAGAGGDGEGGGAISFGGSPGSIELGIWPTFSAAPDDVGDAAAVVAATKALSIGSSTIPIYERWDSLSGATGSPRAVTWQRLDAVTAPYRDQAKNVALCIGIVDRVGPAWPFTEDLDSPEAAAAMERTIDEVFAHFAERLSHLCFGYEVDRYLAKASSANRTRLLDFLKHAVDYAGAHPLRAPYTALGVALTLDAVAQRTLGSLEDVALGDEVVAVYDPLDEAADVKSEGSVAGELADALEALPQRDGVPMPLALLEAGYPSSKALGSSEKAQRAYYDALFEAVGAHTASFSFVGLYGLADRAGTDCEAEAEAFGSASSQRATTRCSMGLWADTFPKAAWPSVLSALSRYR